MSVLVILLSCYINCCAPTAFTWEELYFRFGIFEINTADKAAVFRKGLHANHWSKVCSIGQLNVHLADFTLTKRDVDILKMSFRNNKCKSVKLSFTVFE